MLILLFGWSPDVVWQAKATQRRPATYWLICILALVPVWLVSLWVDVLLELTLTLVVVRWRLVAVGDWIVASVPLRLTSIVVVESPDSMV